MSWHDESTLSNSFDEKVKNIIEFKNGSGLVSK